jgi:ribonuclease E
MANKMLIDATHSEETRVVVVRGSKVEEFDFESASRKQLRGNIYLAKVTRVEPSLQAAFVEYGGNRHGFLAFSEIHPDYYQIPVADRQALIAEEEKAIRDEETAEEKPAAVARRRRGRARPQASPADGDAVSETVSEESAEPAADLAGADAEEAEAAVAAHVDEQASKSDDDDHADEDHPVESIGAGDALEELPERSHRRNIRSYKIQEVIKRRQILLVQVVKEERGNKGAALTTYLSLAGRYCVLMPNTPRGGGISRKITNAADRKRLKSAAQGLELPEGMGLIIRTAGENRTRLEIRRDYDYLLRLWDTIREKTLSSNAPACVYEEGDLIKRVIRDLYNKDVQDVVVEGETGFRNAKDFMRMLMPSHAKHVHQYKDTVPLFQRMHIEAQLDSMFSPTVTLKSGGYIVINQTEALVSIDVNSGRATREHSIEETARKTNLEAASEIGRQLRLRDLAGLIVIDFIDMEEGRNDREVEKRLRDAVKNDRARVQIGKISQFGLLEMSRQRLRAGVIAGSTVTCPHCAGIGLVRSIESTALRVLRGLEEEAEKNRAAAVTVRIANDVAIYVLNQKRHELSRIEAEHGMEIFFDPKDGLAAGTFELERTKQRDPSERPRNSAVSIEAGFVPSSEPEPEYEEEVEEEELVEADGGQQDTRDDDDEERPAAAQGEHGDRGDREGGRRKRRRGGRGRNRDRDGQRPSGADTGVAVAAPVEDAQLSVSEEGEFEPAAPGENGEQPRKRRRRRGRRGGRDRADRPAGEGPGSFVREADRFGAAPDEIDTTPTDAAPGAPSMPVWSLKDDIPDTTPTDDSKPSKKGWWQKAFGGE